MKPQQRTSRRRTTYGTYQANIQKTMGWQYAGTDAGKLRLFLTYPDSQQVNPNPQLVINGLLPFVTNPNLGPVISNQLVETGPGTGIFTLEIEFTTPLTESTVVWLPANATQVREVGGAYLTSHQEIAAFPVPPPANIVWIGAQWDGIKFHITHDQPAETVAPKNLAWLYNVTLAQTPTAMECLPGYVDVTYPGGGAIGDELLIAGGAGAWLSTNGAEVDSATLISA